MREMGRSLSKHYVVLCKLRLEGAWIKRREVVVRTRRVKSEKLREHHFREGYARSLEEKGVEWEENNNVEHMLEQVKRAMVESARKVYGSGRVWGKNPKNVWWIDVIKAAVMRKEAAWKGILSASDEETKEINMETYREEKRKVKSK